MGRPCWSQRNRGPKQPLWLACTMVLCAYASPLLHWTVAAMPHCALGWPMPCMWHRRDVWIERGEKSRRKQVAVRMPAVQALAFLRPLLEQAQAQRVSD